MTRKILTASVAVFVVWMIMDYVIHNVLLASSYADTAEMWRSEPIMWLMFLVMLLTAAVFVYMYATFVGGAGSSAGVKFGALFGLAVGLGMAYGSYAVMDIPYMMALTWFLGTIAEFAVAGWVVGTMIKSSEE